MNLTELSSNVATPEKKAEEQNGLKAAVARWPKKIERFLRKKITHPIKCAIRPYYIKSFPRIFCNSIPKSGTHLLSQVLINLGFKTKRTWIHNETTLGEVQKIIDLLDKYTFLYGHKYFNNEVGILLKQNNISNFLIVRDPRDVAVSRAFFIPKDVNNPSFPYFKDLSHRERLIASIKGVPESKRIPGTINSVAEMYNEYISWLNDDNCLVIKFEDLVGSRGGGNDEKQIETIRKIAKHSKIFITNSKLKEVARKSFREDSKTFRKGQINDWVNWMDDEMLDILRKDKDIFEKFGYSI